MGCQIYRQGGVDLGEILYYHTFTHHRDLVVINDCSQAMGNSLPSASITDPNTNSVASLNSCLMVCLICSSVSKSTLLVASSITIIFALCTKARAIASNCLC